MPLTPLSILPFLVFTDDLTLRQAWDLTRAAHEDVVAAASSLEEARAAEQGAWSAVFPSLSGTGSWDALSRQTTAVLASDLPVVALSSWSAVVGLCDSYGIQPPEESGRRAGMKTGRRSPRKFLW